MQDEVLSQLRDVHLPQAPSWWPPAIGYYFLFILVAIVIFLFVLLYRRREPGRLIKKQLMKELDDVQAQFGGAQDNALLQAQINAMVRRLIAYKQLSPKFLSTELSDKNEEIKRVFPNSKNTAELFALLEKERFQKDPELDAMRLIHCARELVKKCRI